MGSEMCIRDSRKDGEIKNSKEEFNKEDSLFCNGLRSDIENKEIISLYLFQHKRVDPDVDQHSHKVDNLATRAKENDGL